MSDNQLGIDRHPLEVKPDTLLKDLVAQMSQPSVNYSITAKTITKPGGVSEPVPPLAQRRSCALVTRYRKLLGIVTERDLVKLTAEGVCFATTTVQQIMTTGVVTLEVSKIEDVFTPLTIMRQYRIRHLPVVDSKDRIYGVITSAKLRESLPASALLQRRQVKTVMATNVVTAPPDTRVIDIAKLMASHRVSCVIIQSSETEPPEGIITEYDIVQIQRLELDLGVLIVAAVMSTPLVCLRPEDQLSDVQQKMQALRVRRLVVVNDQGLLAGLVTQTSILSVLDPHEMASTIELLQQQVAQLQDERVRLLQSRNAELEDRVQTGESSLLVYQEKFRATFEQAAVGIAHLSLNGKLIVANQRFGEILGYQPSELLHRSFLEFMHPEEQPSGLEATDHLLRGVQPSFSQENRYSRQDGSLLWGNVTVSLATQPSGKPDYFLVVLEDICDRKQAEREIYQLNAELEARVERRTRECKASERRYRMLFESAPDLLFVLNMQGKIQQVNSVVVERLGYSDDELKDASIIDFLSPAFHIDYQASFQALLKKGVCRQELALLNRKREVLWVECACSVIADPADREPYILVIQRDITDRKQMEEALFQEKELAQVTLQSIGDAVITTDVQGNIYQFNPVAEKLTGWSTAEAKGRPISEVFNIIHEETRQPAENPVHRALQEDRIVGLANHTVLIGRDHTEYGIEDSAAPIRNREGQVVGAVMVFRDVTHSRSLTRQLSWQASHDPLTRLINRRKLEQILLNALQTARQEHYHALCFLDLDQFKVVNDTCGHAAGDDLLCQVSKLFQQSIRANDTLARIGGDEFAILLHNCPLNRAVTIAEELRQRVQAFRFCWMDKTFSIGVSIGLVEIDRDSPDLASIVGAADAACYAAKARGRNRILVYGVNDDALVQQRGEQWWSVRIKQAIEEDRFCLYSQAIYPTDEFVSDRSYAHEILLRMIDEHGQLVTASEFIPAAERYNLISEIDRWVVERFLLDYSLHSFSVLQAPRAPLTQYMINLSGASVSDEQFLAFLRAQLARHPEIAKHICFEITETAAISNIDQAVYFIQELRLLGCRFAIDDFGSGMASFAYLKTLPVDYLKIDGRFVEGIVNDPASFAIVESINHIGHVMGMRTIAEFVSSHSIRTQLQKIGVDYVQGFNISEPCAFAF